MSINKTVPPQPDVVQKARGIWMNNSKTISYASAAIIVLLGGWLVYKYMFKMPKEEKANDSVFTTQKYFADFTNATSDSTQAAIAVKVLNGDGMNDGALKIINKYSGTDAANLCEYYAGACYLHLHQYAKAIKFLKDFNAGDATQIKSRAYGMMGDASAELNKNEDALDDYKKAAAVNDKDAYTSSEFLFRAALFAESIGKTSEAIDLFKQVKSKYPLTEKASNVDRYLARLGNFSE